MSHIGFSFTVKLLIGPGKAYIIQIFCCNFSTQFTIKNTLLPQKWQCFKSIFATELTKLLQNKWITKLILEYNSLCFWKDIYNNISIIKCLIDVLCKFAMVCNLGCQLHNNTYTQILYFSSIILLQFNLIKTWFNEIINKFVVNWSFNSLYLKSFSRFGGSSYLNKWDSWLHLKWCVFK